MLSSRQCDHTGIINLFERAEPHISVGSVKADARGDAYLWRCHVGVIRASGRAVDLRSAVGEIEVCLRHRAARRVRKAA